MSQLSVVVAEGVPGASASLLRALQQYGDFSVVGYAYDGIEAAQMAVRLRPHVLLIPADLPGLPAFEVCKIVTQASPEVACALLLDSVDQDVAQTAMLSGARAIITPDTKSRELYQLLLELARVRDIRHSREFSRCTDLSQAPVGLAICGARGGSGRTTVAVNLAVLLAQNWHDQVVVVDMVPMSARAADLLALDPPGTIWELAEMADSLDDTVLDSFLCKHPSGTYVLAGGKVATPRWMELFSLQFVASLLGHLRRRFRFVLVDLPPLIWNVPAYAMKRCEKVMVVTEIPDPFAARDTAAFVQSVCNAGVPRDNVLLVANRISKTDAVSPDQLAELCGLPAAFSLPNDTRAVAEAARTGQPVVQAAPSSALARALEALAQQVHNLGGTAKAA